MVMRINVLLVEDDHALREALADTLLLAGHGFKAVSSGEEALAAVTSQAFSLVVSDVNMPGMGWPPVARSPARLSAPIAGAVDDGSWRRGAGGGCHAPGGGGLSGQTV